MHVARHCPTLPRHSQLGLADGARAMCNFVDWCMSENCHGLEIAIAVMGQSLLIGQHCIVGCAVHTAVPSTVLVVDTSQARATSANHLGLRMHSTPPPTSLLLTCMHMRCTWQNMGSNADMQGAVKKGRQHTPAHTPVQGS